MESFIGWIGGKRLLRKEILARFPTDNIDRYIEVFGGAGWVLFAKEKQKNQLEVFNDTNGNLINLYRCIKFHCHELQRELEGMLTSRDQFFDCLEQIKVRGLTDIQRAARFFYTIKISFGSDLTSYATSAKTIDTATKYLSKVQERLRGVNIENRDFANIIKTYDRKEALFYLDPPYVGTERYYESAFETADHTRLRETLQAIKGRFILSYNDHPLIRELYADYRIECVTRRESLSSSGENNRTFHEVIIRNY
ncbi:MAG: DNA adenine methylase [Evtepia sp.]